MEPASKIISLCGGDAKVAEITGVHRTGVWKWRTPRERGGTGGVIPQKHIPKLIAHAKASKKKLAPADFFPSTKPMGVTQ